MKRFQECNRIVKIWRYRWYLLIPFKYIWFNYITPFKIGKDEIVDGKCVHTDEFYVEKGKNLWRILIGLAQGNMKWYYTSEEVFGRLNEKKKEWTKKN